MSGDAAGALEIRVEGRAGRITLTRPEALNALSHAMIAPISAALDAWRADPAVALVLFDAAGDRAFCAGGDIAEVYAYGRRGAFDIAQRFWADEYRMDARVARYPKPIVTLAQGFVMGGGVGIAGNAGYRIVGESSRVAMPECAIGLIPDVGGSQLLAKAPGRLGEYLGLTGHRMDAGEAIHCGFADSFVPLSDWPRLTADLRDGDPAAIRAYSVAPPSSALPELRDPIDDAFSAPDLATLAARLEASDWGHGVLKILRRQCPLSMACTLALVRAARAEPGIERALAREYRFTYRASSEGEFLEGVRAAIIDKDRAPRWRDEIDEVNSASVARMLAPLGPDELVLA
ncbi:enoyl-CoA hydratase/isomerase family protein [uncultured Amaricoccus sp.]|uniref:enoyl-CoA hydratase/isomerase family protein n=1 Tax=uncultured Amaricoccus sp. TaxID=339341 RepID=UPI0026194972|nr:enoyl-CoA hydratase/isomerase family protein [uncultured Amaricoccus sp.]